ncbi:MAG: cytochrome c5 family protein [Rhodocyclales bacterium]|nr:cytochrome c5 family protein [Rhodocyclales bacterium]
MSIPSVSAAAQRYSGISVTVITALAALQLTGCGKAPQVDHELTATLIQPVARVELKVATVAAGNRTGEQVVKALCSACHDSGALQAPRTGNADDWAPRLAKGLEQLVASATNGVGAMPARGGGTDLTDTEVKRAVVYLLNQAGGKFTEPPLE